MLASPLGNDRHPTRGRALSIRQALACPNHALACLVIPLCALLGACQPSSTQEEGDRLVSARAALNELPSQRAIASLTAPTSADPQSFGHAIAASQRAFLLSSPEANNGAGELTIYAVPTSEDPPQAWAPSTTLRSPGSLRLGRAIVAEGTVVAASSFGPSDFQGADEGHVHLYYDQGPERDIWTEDNDVLQAPETDRPSRFGEAMALDGRRLVVGAPSTRGGPVDGRVYIFERSMVDDRWQLQQTLSSPEPSLGATFGRALDLRGDRLLIAAEDESGEQQQVFLFTPDMTGQWQATTTFAPPEPEPRRDFGAALLLLPDLVLIGAPTRPVVEGAQTTHEGQVHLFTAEGDGYRWSRALESPEETEDNSHDFGGFGASLAMLDAERLAIATPGRDRLYLYQYNEVGQGAPVLEPLRILQLEEAAPGQRLALAGGWLAVSDHSRQLEPQPRDATVVLFRSDVPPLQAREDIATLREGEQLRLDVLANDVFDPKGSIELELLSMPEQGSAQFDDSTNELVIAAPAQEDVELLPEITARYALIDAYGQRSEAQVRLLLQGSNHAPVIARPQRDAALRFYVGKPEQEQSILVEDRDNDPQDVSITPMPRGASLHRPGPAQAGVTMLLRWVPEEDQLGDHEVVLRTTDGLVQVERDFVLRVEMPPDRDEDQVPDYEDDCPDRFGTQSFPRKGCPTPYGEDGGPRLEQETSCRCSSLRQQHSPLTWPVALIAIFLTVVKTRRRPGA